MQYDLIIIGAGPAGLASAIYATRYKLKTIVFGKELGGQAVHAYKIENYPGFKLISGQELMKKMQEQVKSLGIKISEEKVIDITKIKEKKEKNNFIVSTHNKKYEAKTIILALGTERKKLNLPNEDKFLGKGVSYCATCDTPFFKNKIVAVVGGSNAAVMSALLLAEYAKKVYVIYRGKELGAEPLRIEQLKKNKKIKIIYNTEIKAIQGKNFVESIMLNNKKSKENKKIVLQGVFIEIGFIPLSYLAKKLSIKTNKEGFILTNQLMETSIKGAFAAGDCIVKPLRQIITAASDGAIASYSAYSYLKEGE